MNARSVLVVTLACTVLSAGCSRKKAGLKVEDAPAQAAQFHKGPALTLEDGKAFADRLEAAARNGKPDEVGDCIDLEALVDRSLTGTGLSPAERTAFMQGAKQGIARHTLTAKIVEAVSNGGSYQMLRVRQKGDETRALFRLILPEGGLNYHDLILARRPDGQVRAIDLHVMLSGELMSETMRRIIFATMNAQARQGVMGKLLGRDKELARHLPMWAKMAAALRENKHDEVLRLYAELPPAMQREKFIQILRVQAASSLGEDRHREALEEYQKNFPDDPSLDLLSIDLYLLQKKYDQALACVDRLDGAVEGDPFLDAIRGNVHREADRLDKARQAYEKAFNAMPEVQPPYLGLIDVSARQKDYAAMLKWVNEMQTRLGVDLMVEKDAFYADFIKSPEYKKWKAEQKKGD